MGFYGKIYNQLTKSFKGFRVGNNNKQGPQLLKDLVKKLELDDNEAIPDYAQQINIDADVQGDEGTICTGNRWLQITGHKYDAESGTLSIQPKSNYCEIWHAPAGGENLTEYLPIKDIILKPDSIEPDDPAYEGLQEAIELEFGAALTCPILEFDEAGHILPELKKQVYLMPTSPGIELFESIKGDVENLNNIVINGYLLDKDDEDSFVNGLKTRVEALDPEYIRDVVLDGYILNEGEENEEQVKSLVEKVSELEKFKRQVGNPEDVSFWFSGDPSVSDNQNLSKFIGNAADMYSGVDAREISITGCIGDLSLLGGVGAGKTTSVVDQILNLQEDLSILSKTIETLSEGFVGGAGSPTDENYPYPNGVASMVGQQLTVHMLAQRIKVLEEKITQLEQS